MGYYRLLWVIMGYGLYMGHYAPRIEVDPTIVG